MAKHGSNDVAFLLVDGYSILGSVTELTDSVEAITEESHALGDAWVEQSFVGLKQATLEQNGFYDDETNGVHEALVGSVGVSRVVCYGVEGNTLSKRVACWRGAMQASYQRIASRGALHRANARYQVAGIVEEGVILHALAARTADGNSQSTPDDNAAESTGGASLYLQVSALDLDGLDNAVVAVYSSPNGSDWTLLDTFTAITAIGAERRTKTGTIPRYLAVSWEFSGLTTETPSMTFMVAAVRL